MTCHICNGVPINHPQINKSLLKTINDVTKKLYKNIPLIHAEKLIKAKNYPIASGAYADVYLYRWNHIQVAVKQLRIKPQNEEFKSIRYEA